MRSRHWLLALAVTATGCITTEPLPADPCASMARTTKPATSIILVDRSGSTITDDAAAFVPNWAAAVTPVITIASGERYVVAPFAGDRHLTWPDHALQAPRITGTKLVQDGLRSVVRDCVKQHVDNVELKPDSVKGSNIIGALSAAAQQYPAGPGVNRSIYLVTDGWASNGCAKVDTRKLDEALIADVVARCRESGQLPDGLRDASLTIVGVGTSSSKQRPVTPGEIRALADLWRALCEQMARACVVVPTAPTEDAGRSPAPQG